MHLAALQRYRRRLKPNFDIVVDEVNTVPFFAPLWAHVPVIMFIHQLAKEVWWYESAFPLNVIGFLAEPLYLRLYRHVPAVTVSASTRDDLRRLGFKAAIGIITEGVVTPEPQGRAKEAEPTYVYVGRLAPSKRIEHIIDALARFRLATGSGTLWVVGSGSDACQKSLKKLTRALQIEKHVVFFGRVPELEKQQLMTRSHVLLMTSVREGWGLVVTEANACGTPAIVYDVPGLRDSVVHNSTGLVVAPKPAELAGAMLRLYNDHLLYQRLTAGAIAWSRRFAFDKSAEEMRDVMSDVVDSQVSNSGKRG